MMEQIPLDLHYETMDGHIVTVSVSGHRTTDQALNVLAYFGSAEFLDHLELAWTEKIHDFVGEA